MCVYHIILLEGPCGSMSLAHMEAFDWPMSKPLVGPCGSLWLAHVVASSVPCGRLYFFHMEAFGWTIWFDVSSFHWAMSTYVMLCATMSSFHLNVWAATCFHIINNISIWCATCHPIHVPCVILKCAKINPLDVSPMFLLQLLKAITFVDRFCLSSFKLHWNNLDEIFNMDKFSTKFETINLD